VYWNTTILFARVLRGLALHSLFSTMKVAVGAIAGFAMLHVDDYPPSMSDRVAEPVASEYDGLDWNGYFFNVWFTDMMALKKKHGLKYTFYVVMNYGDAETGPDCDLNSPAITAGKCVLAERFRQIPGLDRDIELGFHGYNHEPMIDRSWPDLAMLERKLKLARDYWQEIVPGPQPVSFVPANNWYHRDHIRILSQVFPEISSICGLFSMGDFEYGEYREFGPEPWASSMMCLPRETYGYFLTTELSLRMLSQISAMGIWTHFLHADDVYDMPAATGQTEYLRNPDARMWQASNAEGLRGLFPEFDEWITQVRNRFPWLDFVTTSQAEKRLRVHLNNNIEVFTSDGSIEIHCLAESLFYVRTCEGISIHPEKKGQVIDRRPVEKGNLNIVKCAAGRNLFKLKGAGAPVGKTVPAH
ncbi:MAG TPA: DUF2194 domain-containing protein, partial [Rhizobiales bacterium]|nr:DUF2194 domain-containing protein [Hyphomicrobiales bacterium]